VIALVSFLGLTALLLAIIPLAAILPILLFIGLVIGAQAFQASPARHAPAVVLAIIPNIAAWGQTQVDGALAAAGSSAATLGYGALMGTGVVYHGMELVGGGAVLAGLILGAIAAFIIDRQFRWAAGYALAGAILAFFGFIHGTQLEVAASPLVALGYALMAGICFLVAWQEEAVPRAPGWAVAEDQEAPAE
jgi:adenine/guanine/hypoxanthine permease